MPLDVQCRMFTYEPNTAQDIEFVRKISPHIKSYTRMMSPSISTAVKRNENHLEKIIEDNYESESESENEYDKGYVNERKNGLKMTNENRRYNDNTHAQLKSCMSNSFDSPPSIKESKNNDSFSENFLNTNLSDVRCDVRDRNVPQGEGVKPKKKIIVENIEDVGVCSCHPIAWTLVTSSCLSRGGELNCLILFY
jgi:hypothetical protein